MMAAVRVVEHDPRRCADVQPGDVLHLARAALAASEARLELASYLFGVLAKMLQQGCDVARQVLGEQQVYRRLCHTLVEDVCWLRAEGLTAIDRFGLNQSLDMQLKGLALRRHERRDKAAASCLLSEETTKEAADGDVAAGSGDVNRSAAAHIAGHSAAAELKPAEVGRSQSMLQAAASSAGAQETAGVQASSEAASPLPLLQRLHQLLALRGSAEGASPAAARSSAVEALVLAAAPTAAPTGSISDSCTSSGSIAAHVAEGQQAQLAEALQAVLQAEQQRTWQAKQEADRLRSDKEQLALEVQQHKEAAQRAQNLMARQPQAGQQVVASAAPAPTAAHPAAASSTSTADASAGEWDELSDSLMQVMQPQEVSEVQAREFVMRLRATREGWSPLLRRMVCDMLPHLSTGLYSNSAHLVHELIQNAEDAHAAVGTAGGA
jgi:hypothetical protein